MMEDFARNLILAGEISGFLHDLGKLHPGFAKENLAGGDNLSDQAKKQTHINAAHGTILESGRVYPDAQELAAHPQLQTCLEYLRQHSGWAEHLQLPKEWSKPGTVAVTGLGAPLRQHHANVDFDTTQLSLLGDLYTFAADIRDSALDKGSSGARHSKQPPAHASIADSFGHPQQAYGPDNLRALWAQVPDALEILWRDGAWQNPGSTRQELYKRLGTLFHQALGETRRPTHDVTLWHHSYSTASHFKAALAEGVLRRDFGRWQDDKGLFDLAKMGQVRFRLLGIRWNWRELTQQAFRPVTLVSLTERRDEVIEEIRGLVEDTYPIGNLIYQDDDGVLILAPGFHEDDADVSERLFAEHILDPLQKRLTQCIAGFGPGTAYRLYWSEPTLYLTDYAEALGFKPEPTRQRFAQAGEAELRALWRNAPSAYPGQQIHICPQCGLRPAPTRELEAVESSVSQQHLCGFCEELQSEEARRDRFDAAQELFGFRPRTFDLQKITAERGHGNRRVALISVQVDAEAIVSGNALVTQLARPVEQLEENRQGLSANGLGDWFQQLLDDLRQGNTTRLKEFDSIKDDKGKRKDSPATRQARGLIGDGYWLNPKDGRVNGGNLAGRSLQIAEQFYLRETRHLPESLALCRHNGDRLALFAQRKHASPARLQRLRDDLRQEWRELLAEIAGLTQGYLMPLSLDASGVRFLVTAHAATEVIRAVHRRIEYRLNKVRGGLAPQVSCLVFRDKFPLYLGLDAVYRMERRIPALPHQVWKVEETQELSAQRLEVHWQTPQGPVAWTVDLSTGDPAQADIWHLHVIRCRMASGEEVKGPDRLTHLSALRNGDECLIPPSTFDFLVLEGSGRRYQIAYEVRDGQLVRPHLVFGALGQAVGLLEQFDALTTLVARTGWNASQLKGLQGEMIELYEKWVRDVPATLRDTGRTAWRTHVEAMLGRYLPGKEQAPLRAEMLEAVLNGRFFDAVEWSTFITKNVDRDVA
jgi:hypothetical protein